MSSVEACKETKYVWGVVITGAALSLGLTMLMPKDVTAVSKGEQIFKNNCEGCHAGGKNSMNRRHPIIGSKKLASKEKLKGYITKSEKPMPSFKEIADKDAELTALYDYCKGLK